MCSKVSLAKGFWGVKCLDLAGTRRYTGPVFTENSFVCKYLHGVRPRDAGTMIIRVSELPDEGLSIDETAFPASPYGDASWDLERLQLQIDKDGDEVDVRGQIRTSVPRTCDRCSEGFTAPGAP